MTAVDTTSKTGVAGSIGEPFIEYMQAATWCTVLLDEQSYLRTGCNAVLVAPMLHLLTQKSVPVWSWVLFHHQQACPVVSV